MNRSVPRRQRLLEPFKSVARSSYGEEAGGLLTVNEDAHAGRELLILRGPDRDRQDAVTSLEHDQVVGRAGLQPAGEAPSIRPDQVSPPADLSPTFNGIAGDPVTQAAAGGRVTRLAENCVLGTRTG